MRNPMAGIAVTSLPEVGHHVSLNGQAGSFLASAEAARIFNIGSMALAFSKEPNLNVPSHPMHFASAKLDIIAGIRH